MQKTLRTLERLAYMDIDGHGLPTLRALGWVDLEVNFDTDDFAECVGVWFNILRANCAKGRL